MEYLKLDILFLTVSILLCFSACGSRQGKEVPADARGEQGQGAAAQVKEQAPGFSLYSTNGDKVSLSDFFNQGKIIVVNFWATWCPYCVEEISHLNELYKNNKDKIVVLGINIKEPKDHVAEFVKKNNVEYTVLLDSSSQAARSYNVLGIPRNIIIDEQGRIVNNNAQLTDIETLKKQGSFPG